MTIILGDLHFGKEAFSLDTYENQISFFKKQLFPFILKNKIKRVICLGDFFDNRTKQDINLLLKLKEDFFNFFIINKIEFINILGNHDIYFKNKRDVYTLALFEDNKYIKVIKENTILKIENKEWELIPWLLPNEEFSPRTKNVMGHFEIQGFYMVKNFKSTNGLEINKIRNLDKILSGHFHLKQSENKIVQYLGTPFCLDWNDVNEKKGFWILDNDNLDFIENNISKKYLEILFKNDKLILNKKEITKNDLLKLIKDNNKIRINTDNESIIKLIDNENNVIINFIETKEKEKKTLDNKMKEMDYNIEEELKIFTKNILSKGALNIFNKIYLDTYSK